MGRAQQPVPVAPVDMASDTVSHLLCKVNDIRRDQPPPWASMLRIQSWPLRWADGPSAPAVAGWLWEGRLSSGSMRSSRLCSHEHCIYRPFGEAPGSGR